MTGMYIMALKSLSVDVETKHSCLNSNIQGGARNVVPLIVHVTHFYYYKNI